MSFIRHILVIFLMIVGLVAYWGIMIVCSTIEKRQHEARIERNK